MSDPQAKSIGKGNHYPVEFHEQGYQLYKSGHTLRLIAEKLGVPFSAVATWSTKYGWFVRTQAEPDAATTQRGRYNAHGPGLHEKAFQLFKSGNSLGHVGKTLSIPYPTIALWSARYKWKSRADLEHAGLKRCGRCKELKPRDEFSKSRTKAGGVAGTCKPCASAYMKERKYNRSIYSYYRANNLRNNGGSMTAAQVREIPKESCYLCGLSLHNGEENELDHIRPLSKGGLSERDNLAWVHKTCNRLKINLTLPELFERVGNIWKHLSATVFSEPALAAA